MSTHHTPDTTPDTIPSVNSIGRARLRLKLGLKGIGIYHLVCEVLKQSPKGIERDYEALAYMLDVRQKDLRQVIEDFGLFGLRRIDGTDYIIPLTTGNTSTNNNSHRNSKPARSGHLIAAGTANTVAPCHNDVITAKNNDRENDSRTAMPQKGNISPLAYNLADHREQLRGDTAWRDEVAGALSLENAELTEAFDAFADYVTNRAVKRYRTQEEMTRHFINWVRKGFAGKAIDKARENERQRQGREQYEREQAEAHLERKRRAENAVTYAEYCRQKGLTTTGDLVADIHRHTKQSPRQLH